MLVAPRASTIDNRQNTTKFNDYIFPKYLHEYVVCVETMKWCNQIFTVDERTRGNNVDTFSFKDMYGKCPYFLHVKALYHQKLIL